MLQEQLNGLWTWVLRMTRRQGEAHLPGTPAATMIITVMGREHEAGPGHTGRVEHRAQLSTCLLTGPGISVPIIPGCFVHLEIFTQLTLKTFLLILKKIDGPWYVLSEWSFNGKQ